MTFSELAHKKIAGVPVLYLAGGFVVILAVVAWKMKPATDTTPEESPLDGGTDDAVLDENGHADGSNPYAGYSGNGTVIVAPQPSPPAEEADDRRPGSNEEWVRQGAEWLVAEKKVNGQAAYVALNKYINSQSRSYTESGWVDQVIAAKGLPPEPFTATGPTSPPSETPAPTPMKPVTGLKVLRKSSTSITLDWTPAPGAKGYILFANGKKMGYAVVYSEGTIYNLAKNTNYTLGVAPIYAGDKTGPTVTISARTNK